MALNEFDTLKTLFPNEIVLNGKPSDVNFAPCFKIFLKLTPRDINLIFGKKGIW